MLEMSGARITSTTELSQENSLPSQILKLPSFSSLFPLASWYCNGVQEQAAKEANDLAQVALEVPDVPDPETDDILNKKRKRTTESNQESRPSQLGVVGMGSPASDELEVVPIPRLDDVKIPRHFCHICDKFFENGATLEVHIREHVDAVNPPDKEKVIASFVAKGCITKSETLWCYQTACGKNVAVIRCYYLGTSCQFTLQKEI